MLLLALDIATVTGFALHEHIGPGRAPRIRCGSWRCEGDDFDTKTESLSDHLYRLLIEERNAGRRIAYAAIEEPLRLIPKGGRKPGGLFASTPADQAQSNPHTLMVLHAMAGGASAILRRFHIPKRIVTPATWRKSFIGVTRAPPSVLRKDGSRWLKTQVRDAADLLGSKYGFNVPNNDASDALGISFWLAANVGHFIQEDEYRARQAA